MILEALFNGEIYASEDIVPKSDRFRQTAAHISETMTYFEGKLSKEDYALLEKLCDSHADESNMTNECQFKYGFTLGVLMMCEIFYSPFFPHTRRSKTIGQFSKSRPHNFILTKKRQVFPCEVSVAFNFHNIKEEKHYGNVYEREESSVCLWLFEP